MTEYLELANEDRPLDRSAAMAGWAVPGKVDADPDGQQLVWVGVRSGLARPAEPVNKNETVGS
jgi:hypothetical protein